MDELLLNDYLATIKLLRRYIAKVRPQSFSAVYPLFEKQRTKCQLSNIDISNIDVSDIQSYGKKENIERFSFNY